MNAGTKSSVPTVKLSASAYYLLLAQGIYFTLLGIWPVIDIRSFQAVTGPKTDHMPTGDQDDHLPRLRDSKFFGGRSTVRHARRSPRIHPRAHERGVYVVLDVVIKHTGDNWVHKDDASPGK